MQVELIKHVCRDCGTSHWYEDGVSISETCHGCKDKKIDVSNAETETIMNGGYK